MVLRRRLILMAVTSALLLLVSALPASAATRIVHDGVGDAGPGFDLTRTVFRNGDHRISVNVHIDDLRRERAVVLFIFGPADDPDLGFTARSRLTGTGRVVTPDVLRVATEGPRSRIACDVRAFWRVAQADRVKISLPQSCIKDDAGRLAMTVAIGPPGSEIVDSTRTVRVGRG